MLQEREESERLRSQLSEVEERLQDGQVQSSQSGKDVQQAIAAAEQLKQQNAALTQQIEEARLTIDSRNDQLQQLQADQDAHAAAEKSVLCSHLRV